MTDSVVQEIKEAADILEIVGERVTLIRSGINFKGICPFHTEKTPSFTVNPARQSFYCFGCGEGGDVYSFLMKYENLSFPEALEELARRYHISLPEKGTDFAESAKANKRKLLQEINQAAAACYHHFLLKSQQAANARAYLAKRGLPQSVIGEFLLGYAPESWDFISRQLSRYPAKLLQEAGLVISKKGGGHYDRFRDRVLFPIFDINGKVIGFGGRIMGEGQPKYLNTDRTPIFDKGRNLFGLYQNRDAIRSQRQCLVVEGNFDLLALVAHGIRHAVAPLGTALTPHHVRRLKGYANEIILLFDGDKAGLKAALRAVPLFLGELMTAKVAVLPEQHDPDSFLQQFGRDNLQKQLEKAKELPEFCFEQLVIKHGLTVEGKARIVKDLRELISALDDQQLQRTLFINHFSDKLNIDPQKLATAARIKAKPMAGRSVAQSQLDTLPIKHHQLLEFLLSYPDELPSFREAGIEEIISGGSGRMLLELLTTVQRENAAAGPEHILTAADASVKALVSKMLATAPRYDEQQRLDIRNSMLAWLRSRRLNKKNEVLNEKIRLAEKNNDSELLMRLLQEKKALDQKQLSEKSSNSQ